MTGGPGREVFGRRSFNGLMARSAMQFEVNRPAARVLYSFGGMGFRSFLGLIRRLDLSSLFILRGTPYDRERPVDKRNRLPWHYLL
jgi:hypothetical protein